MRAKLNSTLNIESFFEKCKSSSWNKSVAFLYLFVETLSVVQYVLGHIGNRH